ncbi:MAG TPA: transcriptional regulator [Bacteroidota bacterium]|nr:transcriptional regulator [Bacteroidota bacterium]
MESSQMTMKKLFRPIKTEADYNRAVKFMEDNIDADPKGDVGQVVEVLAILVEKYEDEKFPIEAPDPIEAIKFRMEQLGLERTDLYKVFGGSGRTSEIFNKKRPLNLRMVKKLKRELGIPAESLIGG